MTSNGIRVVPDQASADWATRGKVSTFSDRKPADALDQALAAIGARYGDGATNVVAMQLEYPR